MKLFIEIDGNLLEIEGEKFGKEISFKYRNEIFKAEIIETAQGLYSVLFADGRQREILVENLKDNTFNFYTNATQYPTKIKDSLNLEIEKRIKKEKKVSGWVLKAQIPGKVLKILKKEGEEVEKGTPLLIVEAMKMQNELRAPEKGRIKKIYCKEMETVETGCFLLEAI